LPSPAVVAELIHEARKFRNMLELPATPPDVPKHGFLLSFEHVKSSLPPGSNATLLVFKPGDSAPLATLDVPPETNEIYVPASPGEKLEFEARWGEFPIQRFVGIAS
jgi:hypothetical protein